MPRPSIALNNQQKTGGRREEAKVGNFQQSKNPPLALASEIKASQAKITTINLFMDEIGKFSDS